MQRSSSRRPAHAAMHALYLGATLAAEPRTCPADSQGSLACLAARLDNSWLAQLEVDPDSKPPNKRAREVASGHWVPVKPTPLRKPYLVACSESVLSLLELSEEECAADRHAFVGLFSGDTDVRRRHEPRAIRRHTPHAISSLRPCVRSPPHAQPLRAQPAPRALVRKLNEPCFRPRQSSASWSCCAPSWRASRSSGARMPTALRWA